MSVPRRVALITGGTRGIGLGIACCLAKEGYDLLLSGRRSLDQVKNVVASLRQPDIRVEYVAADVTIARDRDLLLEFARSTFVRLDVLVNNAGIAPEVRVDMLEANEAGFDKLLATNLKGPFFLTQAAACWMVELRKKSPIQRSCIVNIGSISATVASVNRADYCISKAGVAMATRLWAVRLAEYGIDCYEVRPGIIASDMTSGVHAKYDALIQNGLLLDGRWGTPDDVGRVVATLVRGDLPYSTGSVLAVDGGLTVPRL